MRILFLTVAFLLLTTLKLRAAPAGVDLAVDFSSQGAGINFSQYHRITDYLKSQSSKLTTSVRPWGREGERTIRITLLKPASRAEILATLKRLASDPATVHSGPVAKVLDCARERKNPRCKK